jgi:2-polyprenyl-3-methyl-5-hydroxy-6-metoxy-1,4-benzoquinol methylase
MSELRNASEKSVRYITSLQENKAITEEYYKKSVDKTEQQKFIEKLLKSKGYKFSAIADVACGAGTLSYHLSELYPGAQFYLSDLNPDAIGLAKQLCLGNRFHFNLDNIFEMKSAHRNFFDAVFCWQTLLMLDQPDKIVNTLLQLPKKGGKIFIMSLFNIERDVDILANFIDHTRTGNKTVDTISYNTYSQFTVRKWLEGKAESFVIHPFHPETDFYYKGRGLGSNTVQAGDIRLQVSGGYLMNWGLLEITK